MSERERGKRSEKNNGELEIRGEPSLTSVVPVAPTPAARCPIFTCHLYSLDAALQCNYSGGGLFSAHTWQAGWVPATAQ